MKALTFTLVAATLFSSGAALAADTIKIGALLPLTGGSAGMGSAVRDGQRLALAQINAKGGVLGRKLELVELDDEAKPEAAPKQMRALLAQGIVACACGVNTGVVAAYQPLLQAARIPNVIPASAGTRLTRNYSAAPEGNYSFRVQASDALQAQMMVDYAARKGYKKVAVLSDSTPYGLGGRDDMVKQLMTHDIRPVSASTFNLKDTDMTPHLIKAREAGAQVLLVYGIGPEQGSIAAANAKLNLNLPIIGSWPNATDSFIEAAGSAGEGALSPQTFVDGANHAGGRDFEAAYRSAYKRTHVINPTAAAGGYDAVLLLAAAIRQANSTEGPKIKAALENLSAPVQGAIMTYNKPYSEQDHEAINVSSALMATWRKGAIVRAPL